MTESVIEATPAPEKMQLGLRQLRNFMERVEQAGQNECWPWTGYRDRKGYGQVKLFRKMLRAHRVAFQIHHRILIPGECALHHCDNPPCCNPAHLWAGTNQDNVLDKERKGRGNQPSGDAHGWRKHPESLPRGERNGRAKLTHAVVGEIRIRYAQGGVTQVKLSEKYGVHQSAISSILRGETWKHIP